MYDSVSSTEQKPMPFFDEIKDYIGFTENDVENLQKIRPVVSPHFDGIVDDFYDSLWANEHTKDVFESPEQVDRLQNSLHNWLQETFTGPYNDEYFKYRQHIGRVHHKVGLKPQFMFGAMNIIRNDLVEIINDGSVQPKTSEAIKSTEKILDLDLTIMLQSFWDETMKKKMESASSLAAGLAHEILNPLNSIGLNLTLLERRLTKNLDDSQSYTQILDSVRSELERVSNLAREIKDFTRPIDLNPMWHDTGQFLQEVRQAHAATLEASEIKLTTKHEGVTDLYCDNDRLKQVVINLLKNAIEAIDPPGEIKLQIVNDDKGTYILVEDDGDGIEPTTQHQIFDLFFTTKASGTGIGLSVVKKIIEAHGGTIDVQSNPGDGTSFRITLPRPEKSKTKREAR